MFTGEYEHSIDSKNRIFVPARFREELGESFVVARTVRGKHLTVYSLEGWEEYIDRIRRENRALYEKVARFLHRNAVQVAPDSQGRIVLSPSLLSFAEVIKDAVFVGCGDFCEIWSAENYSVAVEEEDEEEIRMSLERLGL